LATLTESAIETFANRLFERLGYQAIHAPDSAPDCDHPEREVIVKRTLHQFGYPPDMQLLATETVLKQAKMIANELVADV
jgi:hypothetical protein